jgi:hypothetical protein
MRTLILFAAIIWALCSPLSFLLKAYLRTFLFVTAVLEGMLLFKITNNYTSVYFAVYWVLVFFVSVFQPAVLIWRYRGRMLRCTKLRILLSAWLLMGIYYVGYFRDWHSERLDWVPTAIYVMAFVCLGAVARSSRRQSIPRLP